MTNTIATAVTAYTNTSDWVIGAILTVMVVAIGVGLAKRWLPGARKA